MIQFPPTLVPNRIEAVILPRRKIADLTPTLAYTVPSLKLNDTPSGGTLRLLFENYPVLQVDETDNHNWVNLPGTPCRTEQLGFNLAWRWYEEITESGHLAFQIPPTHAMVAGVQRGWETWSEWFLRSLDGNSSIWKIKEFTPPKQNYRQRCDFSITIRNELRTPAWL